MTASGIKRHRQALALSQVQLAKRLGVHPITLSRWERGTVSIPEPVAQLVKLWVMNEKKAAKRER
jgi:DNA-binding transcriptional regulator YiaG